MSELMMSSPHNFPCILFTEMTKIPYFSYERVKLALYPLWINACRIMFALIYFDNCEVMRSSTHSFAYTYRLFKKCLVDNYEYKQLHIFLIFPPIYIKCSLFYSKWIHVKSYTVYRRDGLVVRASASWSGGRRFELTPARSYQWQRL